MGDGLAGFACASILRRRTLHRSRLVDSRDRTRWRSAELSRRTPRSIAAVVREIGGVGGEFEYHYDMGDGWVHRCVIEMAPVPWPELDLRTPACIAGENACPPEDVGGPHGYAHFLECIGDRSHPEYADTLRWVGGVFDPKGFDLNRLNRDWKPGRRAVR